MLQAVLQQQASLTRRARRLHVSNLPGQLSADALKELFNATMQAAKLALDEGPCVNDVNLAPDSRFAFVEFRSVLECSSALVLDGMELLGKPLKVQRPNDFAAPPPGLEKVIIPQNVSSAVTTSSASQLGASSTALTAMAASSPALSAVLATAGLS